MTRLSLREQLSALQPKKEPYRPKYCRIHGCDLPFDHISDCTAPARVQCCTTSKCKQRLNHDGEHDQVEAKIARRPVRRSRRKSENER